MTSGESLHLSVLQPCQPAVMIPLVRPHCSIPHPPPRRAVKLCYRRELLLNKSPLWVLQLKVPPPQKIQGQDLCEPVLNVNGTNSRHLDSYPSGLLSEFHAISETQFPHLAGDARSQLFCCVVIEDHAAERGSCASSQMWHASLRPLICRFATSPASVVRCTPLFLILFVFAVSFPFPLVFQGFICFAVVYFSAQNEF